MKRFLEILCITWLLLVDAGAQERYRRLRSGPESATSSNHETRQETSFDSTPRPLDDESFGSHEILHSASEPFNKTSQESATAHWTWLDLSYNNSNRLHQETPLKSSQSIHSALYRCDPKKEAMLISTCPITAEEEDKTLCQSDEAPLTGDSIFPVTDSVSGYHFRNFFCWRCFNQSGVPLRWSAQASTVYLIEPKDYNNLTSFLVFLDENPVLVKWAPPIPFSYPSCQNVEFTNCTVCVRHSVDFPHCSFVGRYIVDRKSNNCYACSTYQKQYCGFNRSLCLKEHFTNFAIPDTLFFSFGDNGRANVLEINRLEARDEIQVIKWSTVECNIDTSTCRATVCTETALIDGVCNVLTSWFAFRLRICQITQLGQLRHSCLLEKKRNFLDQQFQELEVQSINLTALAAFELDMYSHNDLSNLMSSNEETAGCQDESLGFQGCPRQKAVRVASVNDVLSVPVDRLISLLDQTDYFTQLKLNITEENDFDSLQIYITGYQNGSTNPVAWFPRTLLSLITQTMATVGVKGFLQFSYGWDFILRNGINFLNPPTFVTVSFGTGTIDVPKSDAHRIESSFVPNSRMILPVLISLHYIFQ